MTRLTISFLLAPSARRRPKSRLFNNTTAHTTVIDTATAVAKENNTDIVILCQFALDRASYLDKIRRRLKVVVLRGNPVR